jgi:ABC-type multidrug transport system ATPase subunit
VSALRLESVSVTRGGLRRRRHDFAPEQGDSEPILRDVSLTVEPGAILSLLGDSGGGKSTLLKLADRLVEPEGGQVDVLGRPVPEWDVAQLRREAVLVLQQPVLFGGSVREELIQPLRWRGQMAKTAILKDLMARVHLEEVSLDAPADELSGGQRTRLGLARALLLAPKLLLLDEPTGSLDVRIARELLASLRAWAGEHETTLVCVTHRPDDLDALGGSAAVLLGGRLLGPWPAKDLREGRVEDSEVAAFFGTLGEDAS